MRMPYAVSADVMATSLGHFCTNHQCPFYFYFSLPFFSLTTQTHCIDTEKDDSVALYNKSCFQYLGINNFTFTSHSHVTTVFTGLSLSFVHSDSKLIYTLIISNPRWPLEWVTTRGGLVDNTCTWKVRSSAKMKEYQHIVQLFFIYSPKSLTSKTCTPAASLLKHQKH